MPDHDSPSGSHTDISEAPANIDDVPAQLPGDPRRQAVPSTHGDVYQAWWSIDSWLRLSDADEVIYLEGAEDFDIVRTDCATTVQVKHNIGTISLGTAKAHDALENFWTLSCQDNNRKIDFHYLTTCSVATEQDASFGGTKGIDVWRAAQTNLELVSMLASYLATKLNKNSPLRSFLLTSKAELIQERLIQRFHWLTNQPELDVVKQSVDNRIAGLLADNGRAVSLTPNVRRYLESRFWEVVLEPASARRCLTHGELLRQFEAAIITYLPLPIEQLSDLIGNASPGLNILNLLLEKSPKPPDPLLQRPALIQQLEELVRHRKVVLLTGTVYKGKTTVAQLVASTLCPDAWWINLTGRGQSEVDNLFLALAGRIESGDCPSLVVIDDLDISPAAHRVYRDSLALVMHRASAAGRGIILTAQGITSDSAVVQDFNNIALLEVPELSSDETEALCIQHGCPEELAATWGVLIAAWSRGHPKLVQVLLAEIAARQWPKPSAADLTMQSSAVNSARQIARQLLNNSVSSPVASFVYMVSECSVPIPRSVAIRLTEAVEGLTNGGDVLDALTGKWLEQVEGGQFRATALLTGVAAKVWSTEQCKRVHINIHDAISTKQPLDPAEAAALLFHAYMGGDSERLVYTAMKLQLIDEDEAKRAVQRQLLWLPFTAIKEGQTITDDAMASVILRGLQFQVASTLDTECLPQICARWKDDIERIPHPEVKAANCAMMWLSTGFAMSQRIPLKLRLDAIIGIQTLPNELLEMHSGFATRFFDTAEKTDGLPGNGTTTQAILLSMCQSVRDFSSLEELLQWLDNIATEDIRQQFDAMLEWPLVRTLGAFVQTAWTAVHEETEDWVPWVGLFDRIDEYAKRRASPKLGREAAKSKAIILTEYLEQTEEALTVLDQAESAFGFSTVLMEQRANVMFQAQDDEAALEIWYQLTKDPLHKVALDPFAYRRAGISAARLQRWEEAGQIFIDAAASIQSGTLDATKFGLLVDAAYAVALGGDQAAAAIILADAVLSLPDDAATEGDERWEAVQRVASSVCTSIENRIWKSSEVILQFEPGYASSPDQKVIKVEPGQAARTELTQVKVLHLVSTITTEAARFAQELEVFAGSKYCLVRWYADEAKLALAYSTGAGDGFIESLLTFDSTIVELSENAQQDPSSLMPDDGPKKVLPVAPERWFGLLCAGIVCTDQNLISHMDIWLNTSNHLLGEKAALTNNIRLLIEGASLPTESLLPTINDTSAPIPVRCGAAAQLRLGNLPAEQTLQIQALLTSGMVQDDSYARQALFNCHVARIFSVDWRTHAQASFQFYSPRTSIPSLNSTLDSVERGDGTLKSVLISAASALRQSLGEFMERVL